MIVVVAYGSHNVKEIGGGKRIRVWSSVTLRWLFSAVFCFSFVCLFGFVRVPRLRFRISILSLVSQLLQR